MCDYSLRLLSRQRSIIPILMKRGRYACLLLAPKTGNQLSEQIKVTSVCIQSGKPVDINPMFTVIESLVALVHDPEPEHPLRADLAEEYTKDRKKFCKNAEEFTKKNAEPRPK